MDKIFVTQPYLPSLERFTKLLGEIWQNRQVTNQGHFHQEFEAALARYLDVRYVSLFANGTLSLIVALQTLRITGEVITTPFSFVATTHALHWNNIRPVFVDIDPVTCNLDPERIESAITPKTTAILPVHVYGYPCNMERIKQIADIYGLRVIYDAAHTFGVRQNGSSVLNEGDLSILSFHGTKVFTTMEGGAIITHDPAKKRRIDYLKNFGFADEVTVVQPGINAKMNEMQAALGLIQLDDIDQTLEKRRKISDRYREKLSKVPGIRYLSPMKGVRHNGAYFPIFINEITYGMSRDDLYEKMKRRGIYGRRYFYPLISRFPMYRGLASAVPENLPNAEKLSSEVICLPIYPDLSMEQVDGICGIICERR